MLKQELEKIEKRMDFGSIEKVFKSRKKIFEEAKKETAGMRSKVDLVLAEITEIGESLDVRD